jgi:2-dehydro-3-deoxygalactonokinase
MHPHLLAVDWGSSSLRGALLDGEGQVLDERRAARGLLSVPAGTWAAVFDEHFGDWMRQWPQLRCLMAGMVGSRQGWVEAPYAACPAALPDLAAALCWVQPGRVAIVPGLCTDHDGVPDVMRGEETQVFGALDLLGLRDATLVLPGTHSKWVTVSDGRVQGFATHLTGECYALLRHQSLLARSLPPQDGPLLGAAFDDGVARAQQPGGLLHHVFGVRAMDLFGRRPGAELASYLSGLVIGEELRAQREARAWRPDGSVVVIGAEGLAARYVRALASLGLRATPVGSEAGWRGLMALATRSGMQAPAAPTGPSAPGGPL